MGELSAVELRAASYGESDHTNSAQGRGRVRVRIRLSPRPRRQFPCDLCDQSGEPRARPECAAYSQSGQLFARRAAFALLRFRRLPILVCEFSCEFTDPTVAYFWC